MLRIFYKSGFLVFLVLAFVLQQPETLFFGGAVCAIYAVRANSSPIYLRELIVVLAVVTICSFATLTFNHGLGPIFYLFSTFSAFYAAKYFNESSIAEVRRCLEVVFWLAMVAIGSVAFNYWGHPEPLGQVIPGSSTNGIPSYLIVLQIALSLAFFLETKKLPFWTPLFTLAVAMVGVGRGSIVVAGMILVSSIFINFLLKKMTLITRLMVLSFGVFVVLFALIVVVAYGYDGSLFNHLVDQSKFSIGLVDPYRVEIFNEYLDKINYLTLLFGSDYFGTVIANRYEGNPHIAYIRTHAYYGFFGLLCVVLSPLLIMLSGKESKYKFIFLLFVFFALIRALSEPILFPTLLDFFYFLYFFMFFKYSPVRAENR